MPEDNPHQHNHYQYSRRARDGYAYHAGDPGPSPNHYQLRRDVRNKKIAGVCSGLARYFGWNADVLRAGWVISCFFSFPLPLFAYMAMAYFIQPEEHFRDYAHPEDDRFWRTFSRHPRRTFSELKHRFRALDARISDMEYTVTTDEYGLRKAFQDLER